MATGRGLGPEARLRRTAHRLLTNRAAGRKTGHLPVAAIAARLNCAYVTVNQQRFHTAHDQTLRR